MSAVRIVTLELSCGCMRTSEQRAPGARWRAESAGVYPAVFCFYVCRTKKCRVLHWYVGVSVLTAGGFVPVCALSSNLGEPLSLRDRTTQFHTVDVVLTCPPGLVCICLCLPASVVLLWTCDVGLFFRASTRRLALTSEPPPPRLTPLPSVLSSSLIYGIGAAPPRRHSLPPFRFPPARLLPVASVADPAQPAAQMPPSRASRTPHRA